MRSSFLLYISLWEEFDRRIQACSLREREKKISEDVLGQSVYDVTKE